MKTTPFVLLIELALASGSYGADTNYSLQVVVTNPSAPTKFARLVSKEGKCTIANGPQLRHLSLTVCQKFWIHHLKDLERENSSPGVIMDGGHFEVTLESYSFSWKQSVAMGPMKLCDQNHKCHSEDDPALRELAIEVLKLGL